MTQHPTLNRVLRNYVARAIKSTAVLAVCTAFLCGNANSTLNAQTWLDSIGYNDLVNAVGPIEDGTGISLSIVEANTVASPNFRYLPDASHAGLAGKNIIDGSGLNNSATSGHSTGTARSVFGDTSIASGESDLTVYESGDYVSRVLGFGTFSDPQIQTSKVQNHSWIGNFANNAAGVAAAEEVLQRLDYVIEQQDISVVVGVNNGGATQPMLLGQAHNVISVGLLNGAHSRGQSTLYGVGRQIPNIVIDANTTSNGAARTSSVLAVLHEKAVVEGNTNASRSVVIKSILLAGATKDSIPGWSRTSTRPLDEVYGAGLVNIQNSYEILEGGEVDGQLTVPTSATIQTDGYDYGEIIDTDDSVYYAFEIDDQEQWEDVSLLLTWNFDVQDLDPSTDFFPDANPEDLPDFSLTLYDSTDSPLGTIVDFSDSPVDNVEHLFFETLGTGSYTIEISSDRSSDFGFSFSYNSTAVPEPGSFMFLMGITTVAGLTRRRRR